MISFIVPAHNEERLLGPTLDALRDAARRLPDPFEIIVVNDASTDRTAEIARRAGARVVDVNLRQIGAVRNAGAAAANGDLLVFVDADTLVNAAVVGAAVRAMQSGAAGGGAMVRWEGRMPLWARPLTTLTRWTMRIANLAAGCFVFASRAAFVAVGGFEPRLYATEEIALSRALKRRGGFVVLREEVVTSGRKLRTFSALELMGMAARLAWHGLGGLRDRRHLSIWYGDRRDE